ncbi:hypothetical protein HaLaN_24851 [Haematococcus lacustris]|uniref:Uncharacterized protein n=1 Tax=Haematococcus lacustris TaxID=44745 RepID=A0A6A0A3U6_HAELA|nr:hypothetical protein HaLaN_24851 [Haematococcus lacustris]
MEHWTWAQWTLSQHTQPHKYIAMRGSLALLVGVLLFAAAGWAAGNEWEANCTPYAVNIDTKCRAEVDGALGSLGLPKGISNTSPLLKDPSLINTINQLIEKEYYTGNVYYAFDKVSPSAACCIAACEYDAQACSCRASVGDPPLSVQRRLYNTVNCDLSRSASEVQKCGRAAAAAASPSPGSATPGDSGSTATANAQANAVGGASSNAVAKASAVSTGKL